MSPSVRGNFKIIPNNRWDSLGTKYDFQSVMHYGSYAGSINRRPVLLKRSDRSEIKAQRVRASSLGSWSYNKVYKLITKYKSIYLYTT